jgi:hypothetical protein
MTSSSRKWSAILYGDEVEECLLGIRSEESASYLEFGSDNGLDDCAFLDDSDDDNDDDGDFVWEDMNNYRGGGGISRVVLDVKVQKNRLHKLWNFCSCFSTENLQIMLLKESSR